MIAGESRRGTGVGSSNGYVTTIKGQAARERNIAEQAANNTEAQFAMGDFKDILTDIIIEGQEAHNSITNQLLKDDRALAAMQGLLASMVFKAFAQARDARRGARAA